MKKSEFIEARRRHWEDGRSAFSLEQRLLQDVDAAEHAGVAWDPEEEPLPPELAVSSNCAYLREPLVGGTPFWAIISPYGVWDRTFAPPDRCLAIAREAVRRWNAWPELREAIRLTLKVEPLPLLALGRLYHLLAILDGKEGE